MEINFPTINFCEPLAMIIEETMVPMIHAFVDKEKRI